MVKNGNNNTVTSLKNDAIVQNFIEDVGLIFEEIGQTRMAGKILGSLLICSPPYLSAAELIELTGGSKASISTITRLLLRIGFLERIVIPGKKQVYFKIKDGIFSELIKERLTITGVMISLIDRGMGIVSRTDRYQYKRLKKIRDLYIYFERELPVMLERWENTQNNKSAAKISKKEYRQGNRSPIKSNSNKTERFK
jgi:hypothetical protein